MFEHPSIVAGRWVGEEKISLHQGQVDTLSYTFQITGDSVSHSQRTTAVNALENYHTHWDSVASRVAAKLPLGSIKNRLLIFVPARINDQEYDFMFIHEFEQAGELCSAIFAYSDGVIMFEHIDDRPSEQGRQ